MGIVKSLAVCRGLATGDFIQSPSGFLIYDHTDWITNSTWVVTRLLHGCYKAVAWLLQGCCMVVTRLLHGCYKAVAWLLQGCYMVVTRLIREACRLLGLAKDVY